MATLSIVSFTEGNYHRPGTFARLRIWFSQNFVTLERQLVMGGKTRPNAFFVDVPCTVNPTTHVLTIPAFSLPTTDDSSVRNVRATAELFDSSGAYIKNLFGNWIIYSQLAPTSTFAALEALNSPPSPPPQPSGITREQCLVLIEEGLVNGPIDGTLSEFFLPRAADTKLLENSQVKDDGTDVGIQTLNYFQAGDHEFAQHGSFLSVKDSFTEDGGRAVIQAGGQGGDVYAGMTADCSNGAGEINIQSTGITHLLGANQVTSLGDGRREQNGTQVVVNDPLQMVIQSATNQIPNDPSLNNQQICFYLDEDNDKLKVRIRLSDGSYATWEGSFTRD